MHMGWLSEELLLALLLIPSPRPRSPVPRRPAFVRHAAPRLLLLLFGTGLVLDDFRISGQIEDETFTGVLRRRPWDVDSQRQRHSRSQFRSAPLQARRVRSASEADEPTALNCRSILREADGCS